MSVGSLVVTGVSHCRCGVPPAFGGLVSLPKFLIGLTEVLQGLPFAVPVAALPVDSKVLLIVGDGVIEPLHFLVGAAEPDRALLSLCWSPISRLIVSDSSRRAMASSKHCNSR
jgi:hypothetical protein